MRMASARQRVSGLLLRGELDRAIAVLLDVEETARALHAGEPFDAWIELVQQARERVREASPAAALSAWLDRWVPRLDDVRAASEAHPPSAAFLQLASEDERLGGASVGDSVAWLRGARAGVELLEPARPVPRQPAGEPCPLLEVSDAAGGVVPLPGDRVLLGLDDDLAIHDLAAGREERRWRAHDSPVLGIAAHSEGLVLSWSEHGTVRGWERTTLEAGVRYRGHAAAVSDVWPMAAGRVVSRDLDGQVHVWHMETGHTLGRLGCRGVRAPIDAPGGGLLLAVDADELAWWTLQDRAGVRELPLVRRLDGHGASALTSGGVAVWDEAGFRVLSGPDAEARWIAAPSAVSHVVWLGEDRALAWHADGMLRDCCLVSGQWRVVDAAVVGGVGRLEPWVVVPLGGGRVAIGTNEWKTTVWRLAETVSDGAATLLTVLQGHRGPIRGAMELSGGRLLTWAADATARIWDPGVGTELAVLSASVSRGAAELPEHRLIFWGLRGASISVPLPPPARPPQSHEAVAPVELVSLPGGGAVALTEDDRVVEIPVHRDRPIREIATAVEDCVALPDDRLVTWGDYAPMQLWEANAWRPLARLEPPRPVKGVLTLPGDRLLAWTARGEAACWELGQRPRLVWRAQWHDGHVRAVQATDVGLVIVVCGPPYPRVRVWAVDPALREVLCIEEDAERVVATPGLPFAVLLGQGATLPVYALESGARVARLRGHGTSAFGAIAAEMGRGVTWGTSGVLRFWDLRAGHCVASAPVGALWQDDVVALGRWRVAASTKAGVKIWDVRDGALLAVHPEVSAPIGLGTVDDDTLLLESRPSAGSRGVRSIWVPEAGPPTALEGDLDPDRVHDARALAGGGLVTCGGAATRVWPPGARGAEVRPDRWPAARGIVLLRSGLVATWSSHWIRLSDPASGVCLRADPAVGQLLAGVTGLADGLMAAWGGAPWIRLVPADPTERWTRGLRGHQGEVRGLLELRDGRCASWSTDGSVCIWEPAVGGDALRVLRCHAGVVTAAERPSGELVTAADDGALELWDLERGELVRELRRGDYPYQLAALHDGGVACAELDGPVTVWEPDGGHLVLEGHADAVTAVRSLGPGRLGTWSVLDGTARVWDRSAGRCLEVYELGSLPRVAPHLQEARWLAEAEQGESVDVRATRRGEHVVVLQRATRPFEAGATWRAPSRVVRLRALPGGGGWPASRTATYTSCGPRRVMARFVLHQTADPVLPGRHSRPTWWRSLYMSTRRMGWAPVPLLTLAMAAALVTGCATSTPRGSTSTDWTRAQVEQAFGDEQASATRSLNLEWPELASPVAVHPAQVRDAAVIVSIEDYAAVPDVPGATENGRDWYTWLVRSRGLEPSRVHWLRDEDAALEMIEQALTRAASQVRRPGTLWFVFIGHGAPAKDGSEGVLVGWDAQQSVHSLFPRSLSQSRLRELVSGGPRAPAVLVLDACFSGRAADGAPLIPGLQPLVVVAPTRSEETLLSAGRHDEFAGPLPGASRPAFSYLVLGALRGWGDRDRDGRVTPEEAVVCSRARR